MTGTGDEMTRVDHPTATSERTADEGCVSVTGPHRDFHLADALGWREGDVYVLKSPEFGVLAEDEDFAAALDVFVGRLFDYASMLYELVDAGTATMDEAQEFATLSARLFPMLQTMREEERAKRRPRGRQRGSGSGHWQHRGTPASASAQLSRA
jgi:hypothetical protein